MLKNISRLHKITHKDKYGNISTNYSYMNKIDKSCTVGLMCPYCYDFIIKHFKQQSKSTIEVDTDIINEESYYSPKYDVPYDIEIATKTEFILAKCPVCHNIDVHMIEIDSLIVDIISKLNIKGYKTKYSCSGHVDDNSDGYIMFDLDDETFRKLIRTLPSMILPFPDNKTIRFIRKDIPYLSCWANDLESIKQ